MPAKLGTMSSPLAVLLGATAIVDLTDELGNLPPTFKIDA